MREDVPEGIEKSILFALLQKEIFMKTFFVTVFILGLIATPLSGQDASFSSSENSVGILSSRYPFRTSVLLNDSTIVNIAAQNIIWKPFHLPTIGVQSILGAGLGIVAFEVGYSTKPKGTGIQTSFAHLLAIMMGSAALPCGIILGGDFMGGNGDPVYTVTGCILGGGIGILSKIVSRGPNTENRIVALVSIAALFGGIAGYHLSASPVYEPNSAPAHSRIFNNNINDEVTSLSQTGMSPSCHIIVVRINL